MAESRSQARSGDKGGSSGWKRVEAPKVSVPKGGGAIRSIGEKFAANPVTGTGSLTVPIAVSPGRSGFSPQLTLSAEHALGYSALPRFGVCELKRTQRKPRPGPSHLGSQGPSSGGLLRRWHLARRPGVQHPPARMPRGGCWCVTTTAAPSCPSTSRTS